MATAQRLRFATATTRVPKGAGGGAACAFLVASCCCAASIASSTSSSLCSSAGGGDDRGDGGSGGVRRKRERSDDRPRNPCEEYNSLKWRMSYASRKDDCNAELSCVFVGRSITGACTPRDPSILNRRSTARERLRNVPLVLPNDEGSHDKRTAALIRQQSAVNIGESIEELEMELKKDDGDSASAARFREIMNSLDVEVATQELALAILKEEGAQAVQIFVQSQLAHAAAEELRFQRDATKAFAKDFLIQVLQNPHLPSHMGRMLESVFKDPSLSTGIRQLVYGAVAMDHTFLTSLRLTRGIVTWLLTGTDWMDDQAIKLCAYLVGLDQTEVAMIWLTAWAVREPGLLDPKAAKALSSSLPLASDQMKTAMIWATSQTLQSDWALELAKESVLEMIKSTRAGRGKAASPSTPSDVKIDSANEISAVSNPKDETALK